jgi:hypothetical protein
MDFDLTKEQLSICKEIYIFAKNELNKNALLRDSISEFGIKEWKKCAEIGILGLPISEKYGGENGDMLTTLLAMESLGYGCIDNGLIHSINSHLWGCSIPIMVFGSEEQKTKYLPSLSRGELIGAHAVTEPNAGSDVFSLRLSAEKISETYVLNGVKSIVSNGPIADLIIVFACNDVKKGFAGGISGFIVEKNDVGVIIGKPIKKMGLNTSPVSEIFFDNCKIDQSRLIGQEGAGISIFNETMAWERSCLFACHIGAMRRLLENCVDYSKKRKQFGQYIGKYQAISHQLAEIKVSIELGRLMLFKIAFLKMRGKNVVLETSIAKLYISESIKKAALAAVQIHGAYGYFSELGIEKELRDSIAATIYSGTSEIQKNIIAKYLGL